MHFQDWMSWHLYLHYPLPILRFLANGIGPKVTALHHLHGAWHGPIQVEGLMGLASVPSAFQCLVEMVVKGINNVVVYIENLIIHSQTHEDHLRVLDAVFT
jgi:hypothetical protein